MLVHLSLSNKRRVKTSNDKLVKVTFNGILIDSVERFLLCARWRVDGTRGIMGGKDARTVAYCTIKCCAI